MNYHSRRPGLDFIHDEASDGSSRRHMPVTCRPAASLVPGTVLATRTEDGGVVPFDPAGTDGSQAPAGIAVGTFEAAGPTEVDRRRYPIHFSVLTNLAEVVGSRLTWPAGITAEQTAAAVAQLAALGIAVI